MKKVLFLAIAGTLMSVEAESINFTDSVAVTKSEPIYRKVTKRTPYQECWDEQVPVSSSTGGSDTSGMVGGVVGGAAGGMLGNQVGKGSGKTAATIGGAVIGTLVGKNLAEGNNNNNNNNYATPGYRVERKCVTKYTESTEKQFGGYKNFANYKGKTIIKYSDQPLSKIHLQINVTY